MCEETFVFCDMTNCIKNSNIQAGPEFQRPYRCLEREISIEADCYGGARCICFREVKPCDETM